MTFSVPKKAIVNINTVCRCGLTAATPIEIYEPTYVEALEFENAKLQNALTTIKQILDIDGSNILMDAAYGVARGVLEKLENVVEEKE